MNWHNGIIANSAAMQRVLDDVHRVAPTTATVLIVGETGTGKKLVAQAIHNASRRVAKQLVEVNCGAFTETLLESELFGHMRGAFTGAMADKIGLLEVAEKGTFFLDEISEMPVHLQVKLLHVLEEREIRPVGGIRTKRIDVRFIAATNRPIEELVAKGLFREDLYYRLNVVTIFIPPLRERKEDIPDLAVSFLDRFARANNRSAPAINAAAMRVLIAYDWPGNVRELRNCIERMIAMSPVGPLEVDTVPQNIKNRGVAKSAFAPLQEPDGAAEHLLKMALDNAGGNLYVAAKILRTTPQRLRKRISRLRVEDAVRRIAAGEGRRGA